MIKNPIRLAIFASGRGSNFEAILSNIISKKLNAHIVAVISNNSQSGALETALTHNIPAFHVSQKQFATESDFSKHLLEILKQAQTDLIVLAGYMKKISSEIINEYKNRILNIHPALLPSFGGKGLYGHYVHEAVLAYGCKVSGVTVHLVDDGYDTGPPILQKCVPVLEDDTADTLAARVLKEEHKIYSQAIQLFAMDRIQIKGGRVHILSKE